MIEAQGAVVDRYNVPHGRKDSATGTGKNWSNDMAVGGSCTDGLRVGDSDRSGADVVAESIPWLSDGS